MVDDNCAPVQPVCNTTVGENTASYIIGESSCRHRHMADVTEVTSPTSSKGEDGEVHNAVNELIHTLTTDTVKPSRKIPNFDTQLATQSKEGTGHLLTIWSCSLRSKAY